MDEQVQNGKEVPETSGAEELVHQSNAFSGLLGLASFPGPSYLTACDMISGKNNKFCIKV